MEVAIIRYNAGNVQSVSYALNRLGVDPIITDDPDKIRAADKVIFPGVGEAYSAMEYLNKHGLSEVIRSLQQPTLGICLGLQLMCRFSEERNTKCLGIFDIDVKRFQSAQKIPQIGWNKLEDPKGDLFKGMEGELYTYFVHSFYADMSDYTVAAASYGEKFSVALNKDNFYAIQSHPEKSGITGEKILQNFLEIGS